MGFKASIDRIEGKIVVLLVEKKDKTITLDLPLEVFPKNVQEGDVINLSLTIDRKETAARKERISKLIDKLSEGSGSKGDVLEI